MFEGTLRDWKLVLSFTVFSVLFWLAEFAFQFYYYTPGILQISLVRAFAFSGTTFFAISLLSSSLFRWFPKLAKYWTIRRALGVVGTVFIIGHVLTATNVFFQGNILNVFYSLNPFENPIVFGAIAYPFFIILSLVSTDWAVRKMGAK